MTPREEARALHAEGLGYKKIGKRLGKSRDWAREQILDRPPRGAERGRRERGAARRAEGARINAVIVEMWRLGHSSHDIGVCFGHKTNWATSRISHLRRRGFDLPYRRSR